MAIITVRVPVKTRVWEEHRIDVDNANEVDEEWLRAEVEKRTAAPSIDMDYYDRQFDEIEFECAHEDFTIENEAHGYTECVVDIICRDCGASGSTTINPEDIQW